SCLPQQRRRRARPDPARAGRAGRRRDLLVPAGQRGGASGHRVGAVLSVSLQRRLGALSADRAAALRCGALDTVAAPSESWLRSLDRRAFLIGLVVVVVGYVPLTFLGPGTDLDVGGVYHAG